MADAVIKKMKTTPFEEITVTDITTLAGVSRMTFYRNFDTKEDALIYKMDLLFEDWIREKDSKETSLNYRNLVYEYFVLLLDNKDLLKTLYHADCLYIIQKYLDQILWNQVSGEDIAFRRSFYSYGLYGVSLEWIKSDFHRTPEELTTIAMDNLSLIYLG